MCGPCVVLSLVIWTHFVDTVVEEQVTCLRMDLGSVRSAFVPGLLGGGGTWVTTYTSGDEHSDSVCEHHAKHEIATGHKSLDKKLGTTQQGAVILFGFCWCHS